VSDEAPDNDEQVAIGSGQGDAGREALRSELEDLLGAAVVDSHIQEGQNLWLRVEAGRWQDVARSLKGAGFNYFGFLSAIDWTVAPEGRYEDTEFDAGLDDDDAEPVAIDNTTGHAGGDTRFQLLMQLHAPARGAAVLVKADVPDDAPVIDTLRDVFPGADWHERETHEMFGIGFTGHPQLVPIYLPTEFEGHPLRKDFPLLARHVKPWPGVVDIEEIPEHLEAELEAAVMAEFEASGGGE